LLSTKLRGISLQGGIEARPGYKDFDQLADVLALLSVEQP
jgi:phosphoribosylanthranilate isomerase